jgi:ubiquinone/menaquinone biosynthesis C-methylase UbiE
VKDAAAVWNLDNESLESVEARIHDGAPRSELAGRARSYVKRMLGLFPWVVVPKDGRVVELGPGVGYIMQALMDATGARQVTGLDVAPRMIEHAKARIARDRLDPARYEFVLYDGVRFPWDDRSVDLFYSVAAIQHVPKPFAYNILFEMNRCLREGSPAMIHLMSWACLDDPHIAFETEIRHQVTGATAHWHHYYDRIELDAVIGRGLKAASHTILADGTSLWVTWTR